ncbi:hypothetical protein BDR26DRAFT_854259 [Obelidium mucronatum]|nr:hypothetical protein BDR26DRAFT_854259 [Obelidium mucronatum]
MGNSGVSPAGIDVSALLAKFQSDKDTKQNGQSQSTRPASTAPSLLQRHPMVLGSLSRTLQTLTLTKLSFENKKIFANAVKEIHTKWRPKGFPLLRLEKFQDEVNLDTVSNSKEWLAAVMEKEYNPNILERAQEMVEKGDEKEREKGQENLEWMQNVNNVLALPLTDEFWTHNELVFLHGDCMIPNFLFARDEENGKWRVSGVLDLGDSGYGDRRYDVGAALWSVGHYVKEHCGEKDAKQGGVDAEEFFLKEYGIERDEKDLFMDVYELYDFYSSEE